MWRRRRRRRRRSRARRTKKPPPFCLTLSLSTRSEIAIPRMQSTPPARRSHNTGVYFGPLSFTAATLTTKSKSRIFYRRRRYRVRRSCGSLGPGRRRRRRRRRRPAASRQPRCCLPRTPPAPGPPANKWRPTSGVAIARSFTRVFTISKRVDWRGYMGGGNTSSQIRPLRLQ